MGELARRVTDATASTAGGTVGPVVASLMTAAAIATHQPELAALAIPAGAIADAVTEQGVLLVAHSALNPAERVARFADAVAEEAGEPVEDFIAAHTTDANQRELLGHTVAAATDARSDWKIRILARAFVRGAKDGDLIDETQIFVKATRRVEPKHARVLAVAYTLFNDPTQDRVFATIRDVNRRDPAIGLAGPVLWRELRDYDLLASHPNQQDAFVLTDLGGAVAEWLKGIDEEPPLAANV